MLNCTATVVILKEPAVGEHCGHEFVCVVSSRCKCSLSSCFMDVCGFYVSGPGSWDSAARRLVDQDFSPLVGRYHVVVIRPFQKAQFCFPKASLRSLLSFALFSFLAFVFNFLFLHIPFLNFPKAMINLERPNIS